MAARRDAHHAPSGAAGGGRVDRSRGPGPPIPPPWVDEIDHPATEPPFLRMGTRALAGRWLLHGPDVADQLAEKARILAEHHDEVVVVLDGTEDAGAELLDEVRAAVTGPAGPACPPASPAPAGPARHAIDAAGRLVAEDLCLLVRRPEGWILAAGSVCFPSYWRLADKVGKPIGAVHSPVPGYARELEARVDRFLDRLRDGSASWRRNWMVHTEPRLFAPEPPPPPEPAVTAADAGERLWLRSERQALRRLPRSGAVAFTIRTQQVPLGAIAGRAELCGRLAAGAAAWPDELVAYRGGETLRRALVGWLRSAQGRR